MGGDKPAREDNGDHLGYGVYAQTLWNRVEAALNKDQGVPDKLGDDPLVVGIFGEWGAGKSKLLKLILEKAEKLSSQKERARSGKEGGFGDAGFSLTVPVFFQPWKYEHEENLLVPLLLHIVQSLQETARRGQTPGENLRQKAQIAGDAAFAALPEIVEGFEFLHNNVAVDLALAADPTGSAALLKTAGWLAKFKRKTGLPQTSLKKDFRVTTDGRFYYNFHAALKDITRPSGKPAVLEKLRLTKGLRINFVIFIDDLDRCLPEKAVETLELIKTVFNLESFAFVLALDEEVVERGIGHRYRDYALVNKKPEMPITGFEYLEKIVHLPFRLPALTAGQALQFLDRHEKQLLEAQAQRRWPLADGDTASKTAKAEWLAKRRWFSDERLIEGRGGLRGHEADAAPSMTPAAAASHKIRLAHMVVGCFNAQVPRKLIRVVELFNQVQDVLEAMMPPRYFELGSALDPRQALALLLLQLFQPDLYRSLRRGSDTFELFFDAFKPLSQEELDAQTRRRVLSATTSDADLLHWGVYFLDDQPPTSLRAAQQRVPRLDVGERHAAQHKRLPLVERLLEHRSIQRHPFDPLKLMQALERSAQPENVPLVIKANLFAMLSADSAESPLVDWVVSTVAQPEPLAGDQGGREKPTPTKDASTPETDLARRRRGPLVEAPDLNALFLTLVAPDEATQKTVARVAGLAHGDLLGPRSAAVLRAYVQREFLSAEIAPPNRTVKHRRRRFTTGLMYLAPHLAPEDAAFMWALTKYPTPVWDRADAFKSVEQVGQAAREANLYVALGLDDRFDPAFFYLPSKRLKDHSEQQEPIPGFVWVQKERADFQPMEGGKISLAPFLMARYLTTVDQFGDFVEGEGYKDSQWWDNQGWAWVTGELDHQKTTPKWLKQQLGQRPPEDRQVPVLWAEQRHRGSHPVRGVNWFEARAYARWLNGQEAFKRGLKAVQLDDAQVELPVEAEWERAATASGFDTPTDGREYVWGDENASVELRANVIASGLRGSCPVGLFPASPLGICDLNGNVWEWQDNLHRGKVLNPINVIHRQPKSTTGDSPDGSAWLVMAESLQESATPALRGGGWYDPAGDADATGRDGAHPFNWGNDIGFRAILSPVA